MTDLSIIIVNFNTADLVKNLIDSINKYTKSLKYEIVVVDNGSTKESVKYLMKNIKGLKETLLITNKINKGFGAANNQGYKKSKGRYVLFLNSDTLIKNNLFKDMVEWMDKKTSVGAASCALKYPNGGYQETGGYFPTLFRVFSWMTFIDDIPYLDRVIKPFHPMHSQSLFSKNVDYFRKAKEVDWLTGAFLFTRKKTIKEVGGFDEDYFMYTEDVDLCYRVKKKGWKIWYLPKWSIVHIGGASSIKEYPLLKEYDGVKLFYKKHKSRLEYQLLRMFLKIGSALRILVFGLLKGGDSVKIYAKAFKLA